MSDHQEPPPKKRNRLSLSCNYCKKRKVKCDRNKPCSSCVKYHVAEQCEYPIFADGYKPAVSPSDDSSPSIGNRPTFAIRSSNNEYEPSFPMVNESTKLKFNLSPPNFVITQSNSPNQSIGTSESPNDAVSAPHVMSELEILKDRIRILESSFNPEHSGKFAKSTHNSPKFTPTPWNQLNSSGFKTANILEQNNTSARYESYSPSPVLKLPTNVTVTAPTPINGSGLNLYNNPGLYPMADQNSEVRLSPLKWTPIQHGPSNYLNAPINSDPGLLYDGPKGKVNAEIKSKFVAVNVYQSADEVIDFYSGYNPRFLKDGNRKIIFGIFAWITFLRKDRGLKRVYDYLQSKYEKDLLTSSWVINKGAEMPIPAERKEEIEASQTETEFRKKITDIEASNDCKPYAEFNVSGKNDFNSNQSEGVKSKLNEGAISLGLTVFEGDISQELALADQIAHILPCKKVIWLLINKFFTHVYPYMPFFDELSFKSEIARIIGPEDYVEQKVEKLNVEKRLDFAYVGIMLLMIRLAYLSLFSNRKQVNEFNLKNTDPNPKSQELKYLLSNPISIQVIDTAQICANQFDLLKKTGLVVLQLVYALRLYSMFGSEKGDGADGGASQTSNGMIVQVAISMGINREPDKFEDFSPNEKVNNLVRKLWFFMVITDLIQGYQYGNPLAIDEKYFDIRLPYYKKGNENIEDVDMEKDVISTFAYFEKYYKKLKGLLDTAMQVRDPTKVKDLVERLSDFETFVQNTFGNIQDYMTPFSQELYHYPFIKTMKCKNFLNLNNFIISVLLHLYYHYEVSQPRLAIYYFKKIVSLGVLQIMPFYDDLIGNNHINFGESADLILNPSIMAFVHKTNQFNVSLFIKANATISFLKKSPNHAKDMKNNYDYQIRFYEYCKLSKAIEKVIKYGITTMSRLSNRYYYAWRITKAHSYILQLVSKSSTYENGSFKELATNFLSLPVEDIDDLTLLYNITLKQIDKHKEQGEFSEDNEAREYPNDSSRTTNQVMTPRSNCTFAMSRNDGTFAMGNNKHQGQSQRSYKDQTNQNESEYSMPENVTPTSTGKINQDSDTPHSNTTDNEFLDMVHDKEIDNLWFLLTGDSFGDRGTAMKGTIEGIDYDNLLPNDIFGELLNGRHGDYDF